MKVHLEYFKGSGKWYSSGEYETQPKALFEIWTEVREKAEAAMLPDLVEGARMPFIFVDVPEHEHRHPRLVITAGET